VKIEYDKDIPNALRHSIKQEIKQSGIKECDCGCDEIYVTLIETDRIDVKCYDCGKSYFELAIEKDDSDT